MNIGILTYHCVPNFGAQLQTLSTVGFLKRHGHNPIVLHWYPKDIERQYDLHVPKVQIRCQMEFAQQNFPLSMLCRNENKLIKEIERNHLDMIITGSDALFKYVPRLNRSHAFSKRKFRFINNYSTCEDLQGNPFFCDYYKRMDKKIPIVAFSVSSQSCPFKLMSDDEKNMMALDMSNFKNITVRDNWTQKMVKYITGKMVDITPDPVFAFNQNCYINEPCMEKLKAKYCLPEHYVLLSFSPESMDSSYVQEIGRKLMEKGLNPVSITEPEGLTDFGFNCRVNLPLNPIEWYSLIKNADAYIGTRMHPIIVCLHNSIPFFSFDGNGICEKETSRMKYNRDSSKIFDILKVADFLDNIYALRSDLPLPLPQKVLDKILTFNKKRCDIFAKQMLCSYERAMGDLLNYKYY